MCGSDASLLFFILVTNSAALFILLAWVGAVHYRVCERRPRRHQRAAEPS